MTRTATATASALVPNITLIPAKRKMSMEIDSIGITKRVAAYCRVSTEEDNQQNSYATQVSYYTELINSHPDWEMAGIFADEGISGTQMTNRTEFKKMIKLCRRKKIDLVLCKSISRFARNTVDCLDTVRELKSLGINVKFEKENIDTISASSEFIISLYASFAQAESESISKNVTWGIEKSFQEGKVRYVLHQTLGYRRGEDGKPVIVEEEAETVRLVFQMFTEGQSMGEIANYLTENKIPRRNGNPVWSRTNVLKLLENEKYVGDAILQKTYTVDCLTHKRARNTGQKPQYLVQNCHDAIIDRETWEKAKLEMARRSADSKGKMVGRRKVKGNLHRKYCLNNLLKCPYCGGTYNRTIWRTGGKNIGVWRCGERLEHGGKRCGKSPSIHEDNLHKAIIAAVNTMIGDAELINKCMTGGLEKSRNELSKLKAESNEKSLKLEEICARRDDILSVITGDSFDRFRDELKRLNDEASAINERLEELEKQENAIQLSIKQAASAKELFMSMEPLTSFDDATIRRLIERIDVFSKTRIIITFNGGAEIEATVEK